MIVLITRLVSLILLAVAITQKSYQLDNGNPAGDGTATFFMGWLGVFYGGAGLCWLANPIGVASALMMRSYPLIALLASAFALIIALAFLCFDKVVANEAPTYAKIIGYKAGYWLWIGSMAVLFTGNLLSYFSTKP